MNSGLVAFGILVLIGMFLFGNFFISPQQRNQIQLAKSACGSFLGQLGGALSPDIAESCRQVQGIGQILSLEPFIYMVGFGLLVIGLILPSGKKEVIVKEIIKEPNFEVKKENDLEDKKIKSKVKFCSNCGAKVKGKFCTKCGEPV